MKDFPAFTTENGAASLFLKEIPYKKVAYINIRSSLSPGALLEECISFCRICGAETIYAAGADILTAYPLHTVILQRRGQVAFTPDTLPELFPVTEKTVTRWRELCNTALREVDNAGTLERRDEAELLASGGAYFIHRGEKLLGIGWLDGLEIRAVAACVRGAGEAVMQALQSLRPGQTLTLEVASTNTRAMRLYDRLGFLPVREVSRWYQVFPSPDGADCQGKILDKTPAV